MITLAGLTEPSGVTNREPEYGRSGVSPLELAV
jgi:hypothetical protein